MYFSRLTVSLAPKRTLHLSMAALAARHPLAASEIALNQRVRDSDGFLGTVLYVGPVASAKNQNETYCGIEWDDSTRGKHDGSVISRATNGIVRHFKCVSSSPTAGSFVKPSKLDFGVDFASTLANRYVKPDAPLIAPNNVFEGCVAMTKGGRTKQIEFFGEKKIRDRQQVGDIEKVVVRGEGVSHAGLTPSSIADYAGHLVEVDLQGNLLSSWSEIGKIICQLKSLEALHLSANKLNNPEPLPASLSDSISSGGFPKLRRLILNSINLEGWSALSSFPLLFPNLEELYLANNDLSDLDAATFSKGSSGGAKGAGFESLKLLDLSSCALTSWSQVSGLGGFPALETLVINDNALTEIHKVEPGAEFLKLRVLQVSKGLFSSKNKRKKKRKKRKKREEKKESARRDSMEENNQRCSIFVFTPPPPPNSPPHLFASSLRSLAPS